MNLFILSVMPDTAAQSLHDQHVRKMILETAQILDGALRPYLNHLYPRNYNGVVKIPKSHLDNAVIRSASDPRVFAWALQHYKALLDEFEYRFWRKHVYALRGYANRFLMDYHKVASLMDRTTGYRLAMPEQYRGGRVFVPSPTPALLPYRDYYYDRKLAYGEDLKPTTWTVRPPPEWLKTRAANGGMTLHTRQNRAGYYVRFFE